jgi:hypothetical protein
MSMRTGQGADQSTARILAATWLLGLAMLPVAAGGEGRGDRGTVIAPQTVRRALDLAPDKRVRLVALGDPATGKAEVQVTEDFTLNFGALCDRDGSVLVGADGSVQDNPDHLYYGGTTQAAQFSLTGDALRQVTIDASAAASGGFSLSGFVTNYGETPVLAQFDAAGNLVVDLGARLTVDGSQVAAGEGQTVGYTLTTVYQ